MNIESNIDSVKHNFNMDTMEHFSNEELSSLRNKQLANEKRYSIGELRLVKDDDSLFEENVQNAKLKDFFDSHLGIEANFSRLIEPYAKELKEKLLEQWKNTRPQDWSNKVTEIDPSNDSWNTISLWDRKVNCPTDNCAAAVIKTPSSNDVRLWKRAREITSKIIKHSEIFSIMYRKIDMQLLRKEINNIHNFVKIDSNFQFTEKELRKMQKLDTDVYKIMLYTNLCLDDLDICQECGCDLFAYTPPINETNSFFETIADLTIRRIVATIAGSVISTSSKKYIGRLEGFELPVQKESISEDVSKLLQKLEEISQEYSDLQTQRVASDVEFRANTQDKFNSLYDRRNEMKSMMMSKLFAGDLDSQLNVLHDLEDEQKELHKSLFSEIVNRRNGRISFTAGKINNYDFELKRHSGIISSCIQHGLNFGDVEIKNSKIVVTQSDNLSINQLQVPSSKLIDGIANELAKLKPLAFFTNNKNQFPAAIQTKWAKKIAVQILYLVKDMNNFLNFRKVDQDEINNSEKNYHHKIWLIRFSRDFKSQFESAFSNDCLESKDEIIRYFDIMRFEPMLCPPEPRDETLSGGGYLTESARRKSQLISNNLPEHNFNITRFNPSKSAIENINNIQKTKWRINKNVAKVIYDCLKMKVNDFFNNIVMSVDHIGIKAEYKGDFPEFDGGQLNEWMDTLDLAGWYIRESIETFWHAWRFDWRGRMYPCSTLLTPQDDDVSRGLLLFGDELPLNDEGVKWLKRMVGRAYRGRSITVKQTRGDNLSNDDNQNIFTSQEIKIWDEIQVCLSTKKWSDIDKIFDGGEKESLIQKVIKLVAENPYENYSIWADKDIFVKKGEGFQRLAVTYEYNSLNEQKKINPEGQVMSSIPFIVDASSNIYQHASRLTGDVEMAKSVNVLPNDSKQPVDVYKKVALEVANLIDNNNPFSCLNLSNEELEAIKSFCIDRNTAKGPVMTIGYGATHFSMVPKFLTHNGETNGINPWVYVDIEKNEIISARTYFQNKEYLLDLPLKNLDEIKHEISKENYDERVELLEINFKSLFMSKMGAHPISKLGKAIRASNVKSLVNKPEIHHDIASKVATLFNKAIDKVLPGHGKVKTGLEHVRIINSVCLESSENYTKWQTIDKSIVSNIRFHKNKPSPIVPWRGNSNMNDGLINAKSKLTFSANIPNDKRNSNDEKRGLPPNFVHSIDATHMRLFIGKIVNETKNIWSVHDAFGVHPNFGDSLLKHGVQTFFEAHNCKNSGSKLHDLINDSIAVTRNVEEENKGLKLSKKEKTSLHKLKQFASEFKTSNDKVDLIKLGNINKDNLNENGRINYNSIEELISINYSEIYLLS